VISDTEGNIFGGFTPVEWESQECNWRRGNRESRTSNCRKADDSQKSFLFTPKNPHSIPARRFAVKAEMKHRAIWCDSKQGPWFCGICVRDKCSAGTYSWTSLGRAYTNDTGLGKGIVFTGLSHFQIKEIEVFEITD
jgi:hypothetical protein